MKRRFSVDENGQLVDRDGFILGRVVGITLDVPSDSPLNGGVRGGAVSGTETKEEKEDPDNSQAVEGGAGGTVMAKVRALHDAYIEICDPTRKNLSPSRERLYRRAIGEVDLDLAVQALHGLKAWQALKGGDLQLSRVFQSRPGGRPLGEQIEFFAKQAPGAAQTSDFVPSETAAVISAAKRDVIYGQTYPGNDLAQRKAKEAEVALAKVGITVERQSDGTPVLFLDARPSGGAA